jgi:hypothetical protein
MSNTKKLDYCTEKRVLTELDGITSSQNLDRLPQDPFEKKYDASLWFSGDDGYILRIL